MTPDAFRQALAALNLTQVGAAKALGIDPRTVRRYASGQWPVTRLVELALIGLQIPWSSNEHCGTVWGLRRRGKQTREPAEIGRSSCIACVTDVASAGTNDPL